MFPTWVHFLQCIQAALMYRSALGIFIVTESIAYSGCIAFWFKAAMDNPKSTIYTSMSLVTYFILALFHHGIQDHGASREIGGEIRLGKISYALVKPYPYVLTITVKSLAFILTRIFLLSPLLAAAFVFVPGLWQSLGQDELSAVTRISHYLAAFLLGIIASILTRIAVGLLAFDMTQIWGPDTMLIALYYASSGAVFPIDIAPAWLQTIASYLPTYYMVGFPVLVFMGRLSADLFWSNFLTGLGVCSIMAGLIFLQWKRGLRKFEGVGI